MDKATVIFLVLLRMGFTLLLFVTNKTVSSYLAVSSLPVTRAGGLFSVALSLESPRAVISRHPVPKKSGLSSQPIKGSAIV